MDPKQTAPQGGNSAGGQEGQNGATPVFSFTGTSATGASPLGGPSATSPNEPGTLGADTLSTGANVSRTMDNLNQQNQPAHGGLVFAKHRFDKIDPKTGDILLTPDEEPKKKGLFAGLFGGGRRKSTPQPASMVENRHKDVVIPEQYQNVKPAKKSKKGPIIAVALIAVVAVAAVTVAVVMINGNQPTTKSNPVSPVAPSNQETFDDIVITDQNVIEQLSAQKDNARWLEFAISGMYEDLNIVDYVYYIYDTQRGELAIKDLNGLLDYLTRNGYGPDELEFTNALANRLPVYSEIISTLNTLSAYLLDPVANKQEFDKFMATASQAERLAINKLADKALSEATIDFWANGTYIPEIVNTISPPIDYDVEGTLASMIANLINPETTND